MCIFCAIVIYYCTHTHTHSLVCDDCEALHHGDCPIHGPLRILPEGSGFDETSNQHTSIPVPAELTIKPSSIANAGLGVFANQFIPRGVRVGPYEGRTVPKDKMDGVKDTGYMWEVSGWIRSYIPVMHGVVILIASQ